MRWARSCSSAAGLRAAWLAYVNVDPLDGRFDDSLYYYTVARNLAGSTGYIDPLIGIPTARWLPAYPALLALAFLISGKSLLIAKALNVGLALASIVLTYLLASRLFDRRAGLLAAFLLAVFPSYVFLSTLVMAENLFVSLFLLAVLLAVRWGLGGRTPTAYQSLAVGAVVAVAALTRAEGLWLLAPILALWLYACRSWVVASRQVALVLLGAAILLTPWTVRNAVQLHEFIVIRPAASGNVASGLHPDFEDFLPGVFFGTHTRPTMSEVLEIYRDEPWQPFQILGRKIFLLYENDSGIIYWVARGPSLTPEESGPWAEIANAAYFGLGILSLAGLWLSLVKRNAGALFTAGVIVTWTLGFAVFIPETRYHLPLLSLLAMFAAVPVVRLFPAAVASSHSGGSRLQAVLPNAALSAGAAAAIATIAFGFGGPPESHPVRDFGTVEPRIARLGETLVLGELEVTVGGFSYPDQMVETAPSSGHVWLVVDTTIRNVSTGAKTILLVQSTVEDRNGDRYVSSTALAQSLHGTIEPNETLRGTSAYEVPADAGPYWSVFMPIGDVAGRWPLE